MAINFAGVDMLLSDDTGVAAQFVRSYSSWPHAAINNPCPTPASSAPIPRANWPAVPSLGINTLYYPTGASRWARILLLTDRTGVEALQDVVYGELKMDLEHPAASISITPLAGPTVQWNAGAPFSARMYKLDPIPLSTPESGNDDTLWIVPLVCERYLWHGLTLHLKEADTWANLITELATALSGQVFSAVAETVFIKRELDFPGTLVDDAISVPDACFFGDQPVNAANAMDAACWALGLRFVPEDLTNGATQDSPYYRLMNPTSRGEYPGAVELYETQRDALLLAAGASVAGGDNLSTVLGAVGVDIPSNVQMLFPELPATPTSLDYTATQTTGLATGGTFDHRVWCPAVPTASNHADLDTLTELWAATLGGWLQQRMRWTWAGGPTLRFSGFEDYQLIEHSMRRGVPRGMTRIESLPRTWGWEFVPLQLPGVDRDCGGGGNFIEGRLLTPMTPATNGLDGATTFLFVKWIKDAIIYPQTDPITLMEEVDDADAIVEMTGVNRDTTLSASVDAYLHLKKINGEWRPSPVSDICHD